LDRGLVGHLKGKNGRKISARTFPSEPKLGGGKNFGGDKSIIRHNETAKSRTRGEKEDRKIKGGKNTQRNPRKGITGKSFSKREHPPENTGGVQEILKKNPRG